MAISSSFIEEGLLEGQQKFAWMAEVKEPKEAYIPLNLQNVVLLGSRCYNIITMLDASNCQ